MHSFQKLFVLFVWAGLASGFALNTYAQGTAFTYQGQLSAGGKAANGSFDMEFSLFNAATSGTQVGSTVTKPGVGVTNGLFTVQADFGAAPYSGQALWLQIAVSPAGSNTFTALSPLQPLTSTPYAVQALSAATVPNSALPASPTFSGSVAAASFAGNGSNLTDLNAMQLTMTGNNLANYNFFIGSPAGNTTTTGQYNTAFGIDDLTLNTSGSYNTAVGFFALQGNTTGIENTATGDSALLGNSTGSGNTAYGYAALYHNISGYQNTAFGAFALNQLGVGFGGSGSNNIAIGLGAGYNLSSNETGNIDIGNAGVAGDNNIIRIGTPGTQTTTYIAGVINGNGAGLTNLNAGQLVSSGNGGVNNFFVGPSGNAATSGNCNTAIGVLALINDTTGSFNTANGYDALDLNTTGAYNTANGNAALVLNTTGSGNTANGAFALVSNTNGSFNTADGHGALENNTSGSGNIALGDSAGGSITNGNNNIDIGNNGVAGDNNIIRIGSGQAQTFISGVINGNGAGLTNLNAGKLTVTGNSGNFFIGSSAGNTTTTGFDDTALGIDALIDNTSGYFDTAVGVQALQNNTTGYENTATGAYALLENSTGYNNTAYGYAALSGNNSGNYNTAFGADALYQLGSFASGGNDNIAIGNGAGGNYNINETDNIDIGNTGVQGENSTIHIGTPGIHTNTYIAGVINGNGAGLTSLNAAQLVGVLTNSFALSGPSHLNDNALYLRGGTDTNHGLAYAGTGVTNFGPFQPDGPVLWGFTGGVLGTIKAFGPTASLSWYNSGVTVNGSLVASNGGSGVIAQFVNASAVVCTVSNNGSISCGTVYANGVALTSDRNAKENFAAVDASSVLAKVAAMPISEWNYKTDPADKKHLGPMAQDFQTAFGLDGNDNKHISMVDEGGVALAAIQGLNQKVEAKDALIRNQAAEIADLKARLDALEGLIKQKADRPKENY